MFSMFSVLHNYHLLSESLNNVVVMLEGIYLSAGLGMLWFFHEQTRGGGWGEGGQLRLLPRPGPK